MLPWPDAPTLSSSETAQDGDLETYLLLLLSDSNLPTGGFVASSGLESYHAHGFLHNVENTSALTRYGVDAESSETGRRRTVAPSQARLSSSTLSFARSTLHSYARTAAPFLVRAHQTVQDYCARKVRREMEQRRRRRQAQQQQQQQQPQGQTRTGTGDGMNQEALASGEYEQEQDAAELEEAMRSVAWLDQGYHTLVLNHVARRASKAQGIALLTLYSKAFAHPINLDKEAFDGSRFGSKSSQSDNADEGPQQHPTEEEEAETIRIDAAARLVERLKRDIRRTASRNPLITSVEAELNGHFPICWAVFTACMGLSASRAMQLHLFLQARSLFSSSVRLNTLGPYLAHQLMRFQLRDVIEQIGSELQAQGCLDVAPVVPVAEVRNNGQSEDAPDAAMDEGSSVEGYHLDGRAISRSTAATLPQSIPSTHFPAGTPSGPKVADLRTGKDTLIPVNDQDESQGWAWDWPEDEIEDYLPESTRPSDRSSASKRQDGPHFWTSWNSPATTYPLGEIVQARHDQLHSRLFNS